MFSYLKPIFTRQRCSWSDVFMVQDHRGLPSSLCVLSSEENERLKRSANAQGWVFFLGRYIFDSAIVPASIGYIGLGGHVLKSIPLRKLFSTKQYST